MADQSIIDALFGGQSWLERANQERLKAQAAYLQGGPAAMMQDTQGIQSLAGGFGGTTKSTRMPTNLTREALERMDIDQLDKMAFGHSSGDVVSVHPSQIKIQYPGDLVNPQDKFAKGGMDWAKSVDLSEPVKVDLKTTPEVGSYGGTGDAEMYLADGHHRWFAAQKLGVPIKAEIEVKAKPIETILSKGILNE